MSDGNHYVPHVAEIVGITQETTGERAVKTFRVAFKDKSVEMRYKPGQTCMVSVFGKGESMFAISQSPTRGSLEFSVARMGRVTEMLRGFGWEVEDLGPLSEARTLEGSVINWMKHSRV